VNCREIEPLLPAYVDEELDLVHSLEVERHLGECADCAAAVQRQRAVKRSVAEHAPYYPAPAELRRLVKRSTEHSGPPLWRSGRWLVLAAASVLAVAVIWRLEPGPIRPEFGAIESQVVASHVRSLLANHLMDVPSSDQHTVKPWFSGKLDFAPEVPDLSGKGFTLVGGRLDYMNGRTVAALVYRRRNHTINMFTWPGRSGDHAAKRSTADGFHVLHWSRGGMEWWAVSDLNADELAEVAGPA
jgi:anti-sigma factor RsiW